jgi:hypothetical protein
MAVQPEFGARSVTLEPKYFQLVSFDDTAPVVTRSESPRESIALLGFSNRHTIDCRHA